MVGWLVISTAWRSYPCRRVAIYTVGHCIIVPIILYCTGCSTRPSDSTLPNDNNNITFSN